MQTLKPSTRLAIVLAVLACAMSFTACAESPLSPLTRSRLVPSRAAHDEAPPPDSTCRSGYISMGGRWVCAGN